MIHEAKIEFCVVAEYADGYAYCLAKFMHEEDAREWLSGMEPEEWRELVLYVRTERNGEVRWEKKED